MLLAKEKRIWKTPSSATTTKTWIWMKVLSVKLSFIIDQVPVVIYELNESAINFISQESYEKALILL